MPSTVAVTPFGDATAMMNQVDGALRYFGYDVPSIVKNFDLKTVGLVTLAIVFAIIIFDLVSTTFAAPVFGRSLTSTIAETWLERPNVQGR